MKGSEVGMEWIFKKEPDLNGFNFIPPQSMRISIPPEWRDGKLREVIIYLDRKITIESCGAGSKIEVVRDGVNDKEKIVTYRVGGEKK